MRLSDYMAMMDIKVTLLLTSDKLATQFKSKIILLGENSLDNYKSIRELEKEYEFSMNHLLFMELFQSSKFINKNRFRNWYIPITRR